MNIVKYTPWLLAVLLLPSCVSVTYTKGEESLKITSVMKTLGGAQAKRGDFTLTLGATSSEVSLEELLKIQAILSGRGPAPTTGAQSPNTEEEE